MIKIPPYSGSMNIAGMARVMRCSDEGITIAGRTFVPDEDSGYVEFNLAHAFPQTVEGTGMHPQVVFNSYKTLENKIFNFGHIMKSYAPDKYDKDQMLGTILAVEFVPGKSGGPNCWDLEVDIDDVAHIRGVAVVHKAAEGVPEILTIWEEEEQWKVSMENTSHLIDSGFLVMGRKGVETFEETTPENLTKLGFVYAPALTAPTALLKCVNNPEDDKRQKNDSLRIVRQFKGQDVILLIGGIEGTIRYSGTGLTPRGKDNRARVVKMLASEPVIPGSTMPPAVQDALRALGNAADKFSKP